METRELREERLFAATVVKNEETELIRLRANGSDLAKVETFRAQDTDEFHVSIRSYENAVWRPEN